ncbi:MAG TPA: TrmH family RNA methyltransferase [Bacteroidetes bacterium]|nr:TrmH family RNA methyltransferase [Bacteroidota bacterium]
MDNKVKRELIDFLSEHITDARRELFETVLAGRTRYLTVVLEDIYQPHNASAVIRTCDGFGVQDLHVIENRNRYTLNPGVSLGASKWVTLHRYNRRGKDNTTRALQGLKERGYRLIATTPHTDEKRLDELPLEEGPIALLFGTELEGLSETALALAEEHVRIPMTGFSESFNISVSAAICLYDLTMRLKNSGLRWELSEEEKLEVKLQWLRASVRRAEKLEKRFFDERGNAAG